MPRARPSSKIRLFLLTIVSTLETPTVKMKVCSGLAYLKDGISSFSFKTCQFLDSKTVLAKLHRGNFL
jgi:hypothetical protein